MLSFSRPAGSTQPASSVALAKRFGGLECTVAEDVKTRDTIDTQLNVFADFSPTLSPQHRQHDYLFLANIDPELQMHVLGQMERRPTLVALDTMNYWIEGKNDELTRMVKAVDVIFLDEGEGEGVRGPGQPCQGGEPYPEPGARNGNHQEGRAWCPGFPGRLRLRCTCLSPGEGRRPHRSGRLVCRRFHGVPGRHGRP